MVSNHSKQPINDAQPCTCASTFSGSNAGASGDLCDATAKPRGGQRAEACLARRCSIKSMTMNA